MCGWWISCDGSVNGAGDPAMSAWYQASGEHWPAVATVGGGEGRRILTSRLSFAGDGSDA